MLSEVPPDSLETLKQLQRTDVGILQSINRISDSYKNLRLTLCKIDSAKRELSDSERILAETELQLAKAQEGVAYCNAKISQIESRPSEDGFKNKFKESLIQQFTFYKGNLADRYERLLFDKAAAIRSIDRCSEVLRTGEKNKRAQSVENAASQHDRIQDLWNQRKNIVANILPSTLDFYEELRKKHEGIALVEIDMGKCSGCGNNLNRTVARQVSEGTRSARCQNCWRVVVQSL